MKCVGRPLCGRLPVTPYSKLKTRMSISDAAERLTGVKLIHGARSHLVEIVRQPGSQPEGATHRQFLVYDTNQNPEANAPPSPELMAEMGRFIGEAIKAGMVVTTGALQPKGT